MNKSTLSLFELNNLIKKVLNNQLNDRFWIRAETSDVRANQNGHCYLEFIDKDEKSKGIVAKARAMIWSTTFHLLKAYFEESTGQPFSSGLKVLVEVSVEFHELYGMSLTVHNIDPSYTLGDQALNRARILKQLEEDGVIDLNKELELPILPQRIAIISSPTAAGYEDFLNQLHNNPYGFVFYTKLFPSIMQGDRAEDSIISSLERIYEYQEEFDVVAIIRGGGATSELSCFDSYLLAASCAQFPLPIITGIGHERDETVLDIVANTRAKTPTAVAEFLINQTAETAEELMLLQSGITSLVNERLHEERLLLNTYQTQTISALKGWNKEQSNLVESLKNSLHKYTLQSMKVNKDGLDLYEKYLDLISPENILKKGYTLTFKNGKVVKSANKMKQGEEIITRFADGEIQSIIK